jgi:Protein of unknown function (DUF669)
MVKLNLSDIEDRSFEALPAGKYVVKFTDFDMRETKGGPDAKLPAGTPMINWEMTVLRHTDGTDTYKNRKLWMNSILHERTLFNLKNLLKACGWTDEQLAEEIDFEPEEIIGNEVVAVVSVRQYQGDDTNDVKRLAPLSAEQAAQEASLLP